MIRCLLKADNYPGKNRNEVMSNLVLSVCIQVSDPRQYHVKQDPSSCVFPTHCVSMLSYTEVREGNGGYLPLSLISNQY